jgi:beta-galactosidase GanA
MKLKFIILLVYFSNILMAQVTNKIIWGTVYNIFHEEYLTDKDFFLQVDKDIAAMKKANLNHMMIFPMSQWDPEKKELKWERTDYLIKKIEQANLHFIPLMLKEEQCRHYIPIWKLKEIEGLWEKYNLKNSNKNNRDNIDFADPKVFPLVESYFKEVIERYGKNSALSFYNIWNEPHYSSESDNVLEQFREWLKQKYGSLAMLRTIWGDDYTNWSEVTPFMSDNWISSMPQIDWIIFRNELNGILLGKLKSVLLKYDSLHQVNSNPVGTPWADFHNFGNYSVDNWVFTKNNDINGVSYYPDGWERENNLIDYPAWLHNLAFNTIRSASQNKDYILTEMFTNTQNGLALNGYLDKNAISNVAWTALSNDCKGIIFWKWEPFRRGRQSLGRGLTTIDGNLAERGEAVKEIGRVLNKYGEILLKARLNKPKVAILMDMVGLLKTLEQTIEPATTKFMYESNAGLFKALSEENLTSDMIRTDLPLNLEKLKQYKIIFLPFQIVIRKEIADILKEYVRQGGCVVADARTGSIDELDFAYKISPGAGLDELFNATRNDWIGKKGFFTVNMISEINNDTYDFAGKYFRDKLIPGKNARILGKFADDNSPAVVINEYGKGKAILSAVPLGASYYNNPENNAKKTIMDFIRGADVFPEIKFISKENYKLDMKIHFAENEKIVYIINHEGFDKSGSVEIKESDFDVKSITNIISDKDAGFNKKEGLLKTDIKISPYETIVLLLRK